MSKPTGRRACCSIAVAAAFREAQKIVRRLATAKPRTHEWGNDYWGYVSDLEDMFGSKALLEAIFGDVPMNSAGSAGADSPREVGGVKRRHPATRRGPHD